MYAWEMEKAWIDIHKIGYIPATFFNGHWYTKRGAFVSVYDETTFRIMKKKRKKKRHST